MQSRVRCGGLMIALATLFALAPTAGGVEIDGVGNAALDQPRVNARVTYNGAVLSQPDSGLGDLLDLFGGADFWGLSPNNIEVYYDTGAGVGLFGGLTAANFGIPTQPGGEFTDVGVGGEESFNLSQPLLIEVGSMSPLFNPAAPNAYQHAFADHVAAIGEPPGGLDGSNPLLDPFEQIIEQIINAQADFSVLGMPYFKDKVVVMDARALNQFAATGEIGDTLPQLFTHVYDAGNAPAWNPADENNPGVPTSAAIDVTIDLNYANFSGLTTTSPGATPPNLAHNPMIGGALPPQFNETVDDRDDNPGVVITRGAASSEGTWLFDTGAAATIISVEQAEALGVFYRDGFEPSESGPVQLEDEFGNDVEQFVLQLGGVGGTITVAGFFLDSLTLPTDGEPITFLNAPVLIADIGIPDSTTADPNDEFILDGIFGMNFLFASTYVDGPIDLLGAGELTTIQGAFDFVVFDETTGQLHLSFSSVIPEPHVLGTLLLGGSLFALRRRRAA